MTIEKYLSYRIFIALCFVISTIIVISILYVIEKIKKIKGEKNENK